MCETGHTLNEGESLQPREPPSRHLSAQRADNTQIKAWIKPTTRQLFLQLHPVGRRDPRFAPSQRGSYYTASEQQSARLNTGREVAFQP